MATITCDVAIIGGGPGGSTTGALIKKYRPDLSVKIFEREVFPREHVGESQLPPIGAILDEMGCWEKIESAGFPIKIGATYRWGASEKLWDFEFVPVSEFEMPNRPGKFEGQRKRLAMQVNREIYDDILLKHAAELGCVVREGCKVTGIGREGDRVTHFDLESGDRVEATHYIDASGSSGLLRRAMGVEIDLPTKLQNVAFWDYWQNTKWATRFHETATKVLVMSIGSGWLWYIPLGPTVTSVGFICPAIYHKESGRTPEQQYQLAIEQEPLISSLIKGGTRDGKVRATKDWSFVSERMVGENWFLVGEAGGFADPILAAGLTLTHTGAREAAYTILEMEQGDHDSEWLKEQYSQNQIKRIRQHIRFADFWYSANGIFTDLQEYTQEIAKDAGLDLNPQDAFQWLGTGGFTNDHLGQVGLGGHDLASAKQVAALFLDTDVVWKLKNYNVLRLNIDGATRTSVADYANGKIVRRQAYVRGAKTLVDVGLFSIVIDVLKSQRNIDGIFAMLKRRTGSQIGTSHALQVMETMLHDGWIIGKLDPLRPKLQMDTPREGAFIHTNEDIST